MKSLVVILAALAFAPALFAAMDAGDAGAQAGGGAFDCTCEVQNAGTRTRLMDSGLPQLFAAVDANGNGTLDKDEVGNFRESLRNWGSEGPQPNPPHQKISDALKPFDLNTDNKLGKGEEAIAFASIVAYETALKNHDQNKDGKLDQAEQQAAIRTFAEGSLEFALNRADKDNDGNLSMAEIGNIFDVIARSRSQALLKVFDGNNDGQLDKQEQAAAKAQLQKAYQRVHQQLVQNFDKNNDGKLDNNERQAAIQQMPEINCVCTSTNQAGGQAQNVKADDAKGGMAHDMKAGAHDAKAGAQDMKSDIEAGAQDVKAGAQDVKSDIQKGTNY